MFIHIYWATAINIQWHITLWIIPPGFFAWIVQIQIEVRTVCFSVRFSKSSVTKNMGKAVIYRRKNVQLYLWISIAHWLKLKSYLLQWVKIREDQSSCPPICTILHQRQQHTEVQTKPDFMVWGEKKNNYYKWTSDKISKHGINIYLKKI